MHSSYLTSAEQPQQLPNYDLPEIAFIGRSNCGKSSLLNTLLGRKNLARSSSTPGRTQMANFFEVALNSETKLIFADLPGYGFSVASHKVAKHWQSLMDAYFARKNLRDFLVLFDVRREIDSDDLDILSHLGKHLTPTIVLTKCDKLSKTQASHKKAQVQNMLKINEIKHKDIFLISNLTKDGIEALQAYTLLA